METTQLVTSTGYSLDVELWALDRDPSCGGFKNGLRSVVGDARKACGEELTS